MAVNLQCFRAFLLMANVMCFLGVAPISLAWMRTHRCDRSLRNGNPSEQLEKRSQWRNETFENDIQKLRCQLFACLCQPIR